MKHILSDLGEIKIHRNLIKQIAEASALTVEGVACLSAVKEKWLANILSFLKIGSIKVDLTKDLKIEVPITVKFGYNIPDVAVNVQEAILKNLSKTLNIDTAYIVVKVKGLGE
ncbi:MAG: Asp23/Gls24 family envelope stress response protein [Candidatus Omnitrophica bacterium]|nr:Asp23/Gls24 family envelope stress response protein [Candidatus Omnitrophota bacterium]